MTTTQTCTPEAEKVEVPEPERKADQPAEEPHRFGVIRVPADVFVRNWSSTHTIH
jgi:hypothetical protein